MIFLKRIFSKCYPTTENYFNFLLPFFPVNSLLSKLCSMETTKTASSAIINGKAGTIPVSSLEYLQLNGVRQYLSIQGNNIQNPVIFYIHGGPGIPEMPLIKYYNHHLEKKFTIVYWEQRGAGISYSKNVPESSYTIDQFVKDGYDLTRSLLARFRKGKIYIMGHSWGTIIATRLVKLYPKLYHGYIGIGQMVDLKRAEEISYSYVLNKARQDSNKRAVKELQHINNPPFLTVENNPKWLSQLRTERKWLTYYAGLVYQKKKRMEFLKRYLKSQEYTLMDLVRITRGNAVSVKNLWPEIMKVNFIQNLEPFKVPVYFFQGIHDYNCPTELVQEYYCKIIAPHKRLFLFEESAHAPQFEENEKFNKLILEIL